MVVIASNNPKLVNRWSRALKKKDELYFVNQKTSLLRSLGNIKPRVLLLDVGLPRLRVVRELPDIQKLSPSTKILVLFESPTTKDGISVLKAGAKGYANQNLSAANLEKSVTSLIRNQLWARRGVLADLFVQLHSENRRRASLPRSIGVLDGLSPRKRQIAELVAQGIGNRDISARLGISEAAIKSQLTQIFRRFKVSNRLQLALQLASEIRGG
jgi:DNA-binding NarL/FixJ family response regulator